MEHWELSAREAIRDLVARYNASGDAGRFDELLALFTDDAVLELPGGRRETGAGIRSVFVGAAERTGDAGAARLIRHFTATHQIDLQGPLQASGRCYYAALTDRGLDHWGRYVDVYRCVDDRWLFAHRRVTVDAAIPGGWGDSDA